MKPYFWQFALSIEPARRQLAATYGGSKEVYLKYELKNVQVTSYQVNASGNDETGPPTVIVGNNLGK